MNAHVILTTFMAVLVSIQLPVSPPGGKQAPTTARITGRVVDAASGAPIERAVVLLRRPPKFAGIQAVTDADGRFAFRDLTPGGFDISAAAGEFSASHAPYRSFGRPQRPLKPGEVREITVELQRAGVIAGRILSESGGPMSGLGVEARDLSTGFQHHSGFPRRTDDLGAFRLFSLPPGRYIVCATVPGGPTFEPVNKSEQKFVETCYPSATEEAEARPVVVAAGQEIENIEIQMQRRATFRITGTIIDSSGRSAESPQLWVTHVKGDEASGSGRRVETGSFSISDVVPGRYILRAETGSEVAPDSPPPLEAGVVDLGFVSESVEGIVITMKKSVSLRGFVTFEDGPPPIAQAVRLRVEPQRTGQGWSFGGSPAVDVRPDLTFDLKDLLGPYVLTVAGLPAGSAVKSIRYRGRDIAHVATEFDGDPQNLAEIVVTRRTAELTGRALDTSGNPAGAAIYIFPADSARWKSWSRGAARTAENGSFRIRSLLSGDYFAVAISDQDFKEVQGAEWYRPTPYERLATIADRVTLLENDRRVIDLRVTPIPREWKR